MSELKHRLRQRLTYDDYGEAEESLERDALARIDELEAALRNVKHVVDVLAQCALTQLEADDR